MFAVLDHLLLNKACFTDLLTTFYTRVKQSPKLFLKRQQEAQSGQFMIMSCLFSAAWHESDSNCPRNRWPQLFEYLQYLDWILGNRVVDQKRCNELHQRVCTNKINNSLHLFFYLRRYMSWRILSPSSLRLVMIRLCLSNSTPIFTFFYAHNLAENMKVAILGYIRPRKMSSVVTSVHC